MNDYKISITLTHGRSIEYEASESHMKWITDAIDSYEFIHIKNPSGNIILSTKQIIFIDIREI
jgi:hypothetical protein